MRAQPPEKARAGRAGFPEVSHTPQLRGQPEVVRSGGSKPTFHACGIAFLGIPSLPPPQKGNRDNFFSRAAGDNCFGGTGRRG